MATAAVIAGFGSAVLIYGPLGGVGFRQTAQSNAGVAPVGVVFGKAMETTTSDLNLVNATNLNLTWSYEKQFGGPCNKSGILNQSTDSYVYYDTSANPQNLSFNGSSTTLVCLNSVGKTAAAPTGGALNATWYALPGASDVYYTGAYKNITANAYNQYNWVANGSYSNNTLENITSCNFWQYVAGNFVGPVWNQTHSFNSTYSPCNTYYEMNNNTTQLVGFGDVAPTAYLPPSDLMWMENQIGYAPTDLVYEIPVVFTNSSLNGTYEISVSAQGITPFAQTFYFNDTIGKSCASCPSPNLKPDTVLFTFDFTAAWTMDLSLNQTNETTPTTVNGPLFYGAIGLVSSLISECTGVDVYGMQVCPDTQ